MTYSISIAGSTDKATKQETADEGRKFVKALDGVNNASLYWGDANGSSSVDLTKDAEPAATPPDETST